jgi:hypothetical protein
VMGCRELPACRPHIRIHTYGIYMQKANIHL